MLESQDRADRYLELTGMDPDTLRAGLGESPPSLYRPSNFLTNHEPDLIRAAEGAGRHAGGTGCCQGRFDTMTRPLIISDCDEVLLHMVAPFKD